MYQCKECGFYFDSSRSLKNHKRYCKKEWVQFEEIQRDYENGLSIRELIKKYDNVPSSIIRKNLKTRSLSASAKLAKLKFPDSFLHTEETKRKIREKRFEYLKLKRGETAWEKRQKREMSYLEEWFDKKCNQYDLYSKYDIINEYPIFPYFIDFAFINEKIAVELDGRCHFINGGKRIMHDIKKDDFLIKEGWRIFRIRFDEILDDHMILKLVNFIGDRAKKKNFGNRLYRNVEIVKKNIIINKSRINKKNYEDSQQKYIDIILKSGIDFSKFGWVNMVSDIINQRPQKINKWMKRFMKDFYESYCFKRK